MDDIFIVIFCPIHQRGHSFVLLSCHAQPFKSGWNYTCHLIHLSAYSASSVRPQMAWQKIDSRHDSWWTELIFPLCAVPAPSPAPLSLGLRQRNTRKPVLHLNYWQYIFSCSFLISTQLLACRRSPPLSFWSAQLVKLSVPCLLCVLLPRPCCESCFPAKSHTQTKAAPGQLWLYLHWVRS